MIGWDGARRARVQELMSAGRLPNLSRLAAAGRWVDIQVTGDPPQTKPGWARMLTGYDSQITGVCKNQIYWPIPVGLTIFERLKQRYGARITTALLGAVQHNLGARGPHRICVNCVDQVQNHWWDEDLSRPVRPWGKKILRLMEGEPYLNARPAIDVYEVGIATPVYQTGIGAADLVGARVLDCLDRHQEGGLFLFVQFFDPDTQGHLHSEGSPEYIRALIEDDRWLGRIMSRLGSRTDASRTLLYVATDHGFEKDSPLHEDGNFQESRRSWLVTNDLAVRRGQGDICDIPTTILKRFDVRAARSDTPLKGQPLD